MIQKKLVQLFSSIRIFSNIFTVTNESHTLSADLMPPSTYIDENQQVKIKYPTSLLFSLIKTTQKYQKGSKAEYYVLKHNEMLELGCWDWRGGRFEQVNNYKAVVGNLKEAQNRKQISLMFFDKNQKEGEKRKEFMVSVPVFVHFQHLIVSGINEYTNMRSSQLSSINTLINKINIK